MKHMEFVEALKSYGWKIILCDEKHPNEKYILLVAPNPRDVACAVYNNGIIIIHRADYYVNELHEFFCRFDDYTPSYEEMSTVEIHLAKNIMYICDAPELLNILSEYRNGEQLVIRLEPLKIAHIINRL